MGRPEFGDEFSAAFYRPADGARADPERSCNTSPCQPYLGDGDVRDDRPGSRNRVVA